MSWNPYRNSNGAERAPVYITDPSGRLRGAFSDGDSAFYFPYTPTITFISASGYSSYDMTHSNFQQKAFDMSQNTMTTITAPIPVENEEQAVSLLEGMQFFRGAMKMNFGPDDPDRGLPPPILRFNAYGIYRNVPVVVQDFTHNLDAEIDYITIENGTYSGTRVPVINTFVMTLLTTYSPKNVRDNFTLDDYITGNLRDQGYV